jgi:signal transduction histidine kinase
VSTDEDTGLEPLRSRVDDRAASLAALAHELRAPLTSIEGWVELLLDGALGELSAEQVRAVEVLGRNAARVRALVAELQMPLTHQSLHDASFATATTPARDAPDAVAVDLTAVVGAAVDLLRPTARLGGVVLDERPSARRLLVVGDALRLEGAVVNVLGNAVKYTPRGGGVTVRTVEEDGRVVVEVVDTGIGIPFDELAHLTEPWFRARNATASGIDGDGLGLALVRDVVEAHGGEVSLTSVDGSGTTVRLLLPAAPAGAGTGNAVPAPTV